MMLSDMRNLLTTLLMYLCMVGTPLMAQQVIFGVTPAPSALSSGLVVSSVHSDSPAAIAGLQPADIITKVDATPISTAAELRQTLSNYIPGDVVRVEYIRGNTTGITLVELCARPTAEHRPGKAPAALTPEMRLQFIQTKSRLRILLSRLPQYAELNAITADVHEMVTLARNTPSSHDGWMQGHHIEVSVRYNDSHGSVILHALGDSLEIEILTPHGDSIIRTSINSRQDCTALPTLVRNRLEQL